MFMSDGAGKEHVQATDYPGESRGLSLFTAEGWGAKIWGFQTLIMLMVYSPHAHQSTMHSVNPLSEGPRFL